MKIEVDPKTMLSKEVVNTTWNEAQEAGLPFEIYIFKKYNELRLNEGAAVVEQTAKVERVADLKPAPSKEEVPAKEEVVDPEEIQSSKVFGPFDHLDLLSKGRTGTRAHNLLVANFADVDEVIKKTYKELKGVQGMGQGSLDALVTSLIDQEHISDISDLGNNDTPEEEAESSFHDKLDAVDTSDKASVGEACRIYQAAWKLDHEVAHKELKEVISGIYIPNDLETYVPTVASIKDALPMSDSQTETVLRLGKEVGEEASFTEERAIAMCGKEFAYLSYSNATQLIEELKADLRKDNVVVDENFSF